jgi:ethanolamine ammonia-lyase small subunit
MKANCLRPRHSARTATQVTYSDLSPLAQWQSNSSHESWLAAQAATSARLHLGADGGKIATKSCAKSSALVECPWLRRSA